jgi:thymidine kinase
MESFSFDGNTSFSDELHNFFGVNNKNPNCIFIDEAQFLNKKQVDELLHIAVFK